MLVTKNTTAPVLDKAQKTDALLVVEVGELLFGKQWKKPFSERFRINARTLLRISAAASEGREYRIPKGLLEELMAEILRREREMENVWSEVYQRWLDG